MFFHFQPVRQQEIVNPIIKIIGKSTVHVVDGSVPIQNSTIDKVRVSRLTLFI